MYLGARGGLLFAMLRSELLAQPAALSIGHITTSLLRHPQNDPPWNIRKDFGGETNTTPHAACPHFK